MKKEQILPFQFIIVGRIRKNDSQAKQKRFSNNLQTEGKEMNGQEGAEKVPGKSHTAIK